MKKYITLSFKDNTQGKKQMQATIERMTEQGWEIKNADTVSHGYSAVKTIALGSVWLPLALLGRKGNTLEVIMEKEITEEAVKREADQDKFLSSGRVKIPLNADGSINCPTCKIPMSYKDTRVLFRNVRKFTCPQCNRKPTYYLEYIEWLQKQQD